MKIFKPLCLSAMLRTVDIGGEARVSVSAFVCFDLVSGNALLESSLWETVEQALGMDGVLDDGFPKARGEALVTGSAHGTEAVTVGVALGPLSFEATVPPGLLPARLVGPLPFDDSRRQALLGTFDARWLASSFPSLPRDLALEAFNVAAHSLRGDGYFRGDEAFTLSGLRADGSRVEGVLPGLSVRGFASRGGAPEAVEMVLDTVHFFPDQQRAAMIFRGAVSVDIGRLLLALERVVSPQAESHYLDLLSRAPSLRDAPLAPPDAEGLSALAARAGGAQRPGVREARAATRAIAEREVLRQRLVRLGVEPESFLDPLAPEETTDAPSTGEGLDVQLFSRVDRSVEHRRAADALRDRVEARTKALCGQLEISPAVIGARVAGPPHPALDAPSARALVAYRRTAHLRPVAVRDAAAGAALRAIMVARQAAGASLAGADLTGADLSRMTLVGLDLRDAMLEGADLTDADLTDADLTGAVLARAQLSGATLTRTLLRGANLGEAVLRGARSEGGLELSGATLWRTVLADSTLVGASLVGATLEDVDLVGASLAGMLAKGASFHRVALADARLVGAQLQRALFAGCDLSRADLSRADLTGATLAGCTAPDSRFCGASAEGLRVVDDRSMTSADFSGAKLTHATLRGLRGRGALLTGCAADRSDWSEADLREADLTGASLVDALLIDVDLRGAKAVGAAMLGAVLQRAKVEGTDLRDAVLFGADLVGWHGAPAETLGLLTDRARVSRGPA